MGLRFACMNMSKLNWISGVFHRSLSAWGRETSPRRQRKEEQRCSQRRLNCLIGSREWDTTKWGQEAGKAIVSFMMTENQIIAYTLGGKRQGGQQVKTEGESVRYMSPLLWTRYQGWGHLQGKHWGQAWDWGSLDLKDTNTGKKSMWFAFFCQLEKRKDCEKELLALFLQMSPKTSNVHFIIQLTLCNCSKSPLRPTIFNILNNSARIK